MADSELAQAVQGSVWLTGQVCSRERRRGRYTPESMAHPAKMLPSIARYAIATYTVAGDWVVDPMCGIGTSLVEATYLGRNAFGVELEERWARLGAANLGLAAERGATGIGEVVHGDGRGLQTALPPDLRGGVALVLTSPPYGPYTHGQARTPGPRRGKVGKINHRYGGEPTNLAHVSPDDLASGLTRILAGCVGVLRPGGHVVITARPWRHQGELVDIPGMVHAAGESAGLRLVDRCVALIAGVRDGRLVPRASFFQLRNIRAARAAGDPQWLIAHEDTLVFQSPSGSSI